MNFLKGSHWLVPAALAALASSCTTFSPLTATSNEIGPKEGRSCAYTFFGLFNFAGNNDIFTAAYGAGIHKISVVDSKVTQYLVYQRKCTLVYGE